MVAVPIWLGLLLGIPAASFNYAAFEDVYVDVRQYYGFINSPLITKGNRTLDKQFQLGVNYTFFKAFYWHNDIIGQMDKVNHKTGQFRTVAWNSTFGLRVTPAFEIEIGHRSTHILDDVFVHSQRPFYNEDYIGFRLYLYRANKPKAAFGN